MFMKSKYFYIGLVLDSVCVWLLFLLFSFNIPLGVIVLVVLFFTFDLPLSFHCKEYYESRAEERKREKRSKEKRGPVFAHLIGEKALTQTALSPQGFVTINDEKVDAVVECGYLPPQTAVRIVDSKSYYVVVEEVERV